MVRLDIVNQWLEFRKKSKNKLQAVLLWVESAKSIDAIKLIKICNFIHDKLCEMLQTVLNVKSSDLYKNEQISIDDVETVKKHLMKLFGNVRRANNMN